MPKRLSATSRRLSLTGFFLFGSTPPAAGLAIWDRHAETLAHTQSEMVKLSVVLGEQTARSIQAIDLVLQEMQARVHTAGVPQPDQFRQFIGSQALHDFLHERLKNLPQARAIGLVDSEGWLANGSRFWPIPRVDLSDRDYYKHFREHDDPGLFISSPGRDLISRRWSFFLPRPANAPDGAFPGIVLGLVDAQYLQDFYRAISSTDETIALFRRDGTLLTRHPHLEALMSAQIPPASLWHASIAKGGGTFRAPSFYSGTPMIISARPVSEYPLVINVGIAESAAFAGWRREAALIALAALCASIGIATLFAALAARSRKLEQQTAE